MSEAEEIKRDGATPVKNSGRGLHKGDAILEPFLIDYKEYPKGFNVTPQAWAKISTDSIKNGRRQPTLKLVIGDEQKMRVWVVGDKMFHEMLDAWNQVYGKES